MRKLLSTLLLLLALNGLAFAAEPVNVNTADASTIAASLTGVGESKAEAIVAYREANGPFEHADELVNVKGIGIKTVDKNRDNIRLSDQLASE